MNQLYEKVAYLKGLAEGMGIKDDTKEGKLLLSILEAFEEFADSIEMLDNEVAELHDYVEAIDEDLSDIEEELFGEDDEDDEEYEDIDFVEVECPHCHEILYLDEDFMCNDDEENEVICPNCREKIVIDENCCNDDDDEHNHS
ncbi:MAG TPA: hypothetical protein GX503_03820 [Clostridiales bacterium]|nr:hypothetical protein [Clostridiales bacterium]